MHATKLPSSPSSSSPPEYTATGPGAARAMVANEVETLRVPTNCLDVLAQHRGQLEEQMADLQANLDELKTHQREARALLAKLDRKGGKA